MWARTRSGNWTRTCSPIRAQARLEPADAGAFADGKSGFTTGRYKMIARTDKGEDEIRSTGAYITWWSKGDDRRWKVILDTGAPDPPKK